ncbi:MAG: YraN family protein [Clostridiales Family XIII bacterium]|jgi:putative endonuclease|nr:YraN family protein [Clostridiales Family XIII bacterium]
MKIGQRGELLAASYLEKQGYQILSRNFSCKLGEIDIVAGRDDIICFVEVKSRRGAKYGRPAEAVTANKREHIRRTASYFLFSKWRDLPIRDDTCFRFDVIEIFCAEGGDVRVEYIENAFC